MARARIITSSRAPLRWSKSKAVVWSIATFAVLAFAVLVLLGGQAEGMSFWVVRGIAAVAFAVSIYLTLRDSIEAFQLVLGGRPLRESLRLLIFKGMR